MSPSQPARINLSNLKSQILRKLGPERSQRYFSYLNRFLFRKLGASEFKKLCFLTFGRENIHLHNKLISGILRNAHYSKCPPPLKPPVSLGKNFRKRTMLSVHLLHLLLQIKSGPMVTSCRLLLGK
ncbi:putative transcriptional coactivator Hfi1/Transcriptional adapter 1 [Dioscorea sansibarensis]